MSDLPDHKDEKNSVDAEFTDAEVDPPFSEQTPAIMDAPRTRADEDEILKRFLTDDEIAGLSPEEKAAIIKEHEGQGTMTGAEGSPLGSLDRHPDLRLLFKPQPRERTWAHLAGSVMFLGALGLGAYYFATHTASHRKPEPPPPKPGWEQLTRCSFLTSFDGSKDLSLWDDGRAELYDNINKQQDAVEGEWRFDKGTNLFAVIFDGVPKSYAMVEPGQGPICMLLMGDLRSADLQESWFSPTPDEGDRLEYERP